MLVNEAQTFPQILENLTLIRIQASLAKFPWKTFHEKFLIICCTKECWKVSNDKKNEKLGKSRPRIKVSEKAF